MLKARSSEQARRLKDKVVVITGASAGVGRATALEFARSGAKLGLISRNRRRLETLADEVRLMGSQAEIFPADVADAEKVESAACFFEQKLGPIDIWINNAMVSVFSPIHEMTPEEFKRVTEVTYLGYVYGSLSALRRMRAKDHGQIIQVGSALAYRSIPLQSAYCAAKHAIHGFTESLRTELIHDKSQVRVSEVQLPAHNTPQFSWVKSRLPNEPQPVPPIFQPEVAAQAILWAALHPKKREIFLGFPAVKAIVGDRLFPALGDWYLARAGYGAQQTEKPVAPDRPENLWHSPEGDYGAHGNFDHRAKPYSKQFLLRMNASWLLPGAAALIAAVLGLQRAARMDRNSGLGVARSEKDAERLSTRQVGRGRAILA